MSGLKSGVLVLLLTIPFGLYIAWQVQGATRDTLIGPEPPTENGLPTKEKLAELHTKTESWAKQVRQTGTVALQFQTPKPSEKTDDPECAAVASAVAKRTSLLTNLEKLVAGVDRPVFTGEHKDLFVEWQQGMSRLTQSEQAIRDWLIRPFSDPVDSPSAAQAAMESFEKLATEYQNHSTFADKAKLTVWRIEARVKVIEALDEAATVPYEAALELPLPFPKNDQLVEKAINAPAGILTQVKVLEAELIRAKDDKHMIPDRVAQKADKAKTRAQEWEAKQELLALFADPELFTDPTKAATWIKDIDEQFKHMEKQSKGQELIRTKVQEFCEAYLPTEVVLDDEVKWKGTTEPRDRVVINGLKKSGGVVEKKVPLTADIDGLNEFNVRAKYPGGGTTEVNGMFGVFSDLAPTEISEAAVVYQTARRGVVGPVGSPKWSVKSIAQLKKTCEDPSEAINKVKAPGQSESLRLGDRLDALNLAAEKHPELFEQKP